MSIKEPGIMFDATNSWNGYNHQGKIALAFSLALNKIYAGDTFQTILIDDPIQCMDDINMISFVELLRREFSQSQIILSTHEDTFSKYICYKFQKYGLTQQTITLKNS